MQKFVKLATLAILLASGGAFAKSTLHQPLPAMVSPQASNYSVSIITPTQEQAYQRPAQTVEIAIQVSQKLHPLDTLVILLDDKPLAYNKESVSFASVDYNPGEHTVKVVIKNEKGAVVASDERKIYLIQNTALMRHQREYAKQKAEYDALPWHKKLLTPKPVPKSEIPLVKGVEMVQ